MPLDRIKKAALRVAKSHLEEFEYYSLVEDESLENFTHDELMEIHRLITVKIKPFIPNS